MKSGSVLADKLESRDFIFTAEYLPITSIDSSHIDNCIKFFGTGITAVNVADNHYGVSLSSLAASVALSRSGIEPVYQIVTRDRNRIALQSDLLGAAFLGIKNVLCLSGYHQTLIGCPESANVFDIDSIQLVSILKKMNEGYLLDGREIQGNFSMLTGAVANPGLKPLELNMIRLSKKIAAGADFIQTQAVFDVDVFKQWLDAAGSEGLTENTAILAGILPLQNADQARELTDKYTDYHIPDAIVDRLQSSGDPDAQKKEGVRIAAEIMDRIKDLPGLRGFHLLSGGNESVVPELIEMVRK